MSNPIRDANHPDADPVPYNPNVMLTHESIGVSVEKQRTLPGHVLRLILSLCGILGTVWSFTDFFRLPVRLPLIFGVTVVFAVLTRFLFRYPKHGLIFLLAESVLIPAVMLRHTPAVAAGAENIFDRMMQIVTHQVTPARTRFAEGLTETQCTELTLILICGLLVLILEFSENSRICFLLRFLVTFMFLETGLYFGLETHPAAVLLLLVFWIGSMLISMSRRPFGLRSGHKAITSRRTFKISVGTRGASADAQILYIALLTLACGLLIGIFTRNYLRSDEMDRRRSRMLDTIYGFSFRDVTGLLDNLPFDFGPNVITDEINLQRNPDLHFDGHTALQIVSDPALIRDDYYLRGIARMEYTGHGWANRTGKYRSVRKLLNDLAVDNRMPQTIWHSAHVDELRNVSGKFPVVHWEISAMQSEAVNYFPYQTLFDTGTKFVYDTEATLKSQRNYDYWIISNPRANLRADWPSLAETAAPSADPQIREYEQFVQENYLSIPDSEAMQRVYRDFMQYAAPSGASLDQQINAVRNYIWAHAEYDMQPGEFPATEDYIEYFLTQAHKGYCAHYASTAVVLCRMCGIPARYAQGFVMSAGDVAAAQRRAPGNDQPITVEVPDHRAHAWAEIYIQGYGWIPCEFTEGILEQWHASVSDPEPAQSSVSVTTQTTVSTTATTTTTAPGSTLSTSTTQTTVSGTGGNTPGGSDARLPGWLLPALLIPLLIAAAVWLWRKLHFRIVAHRQSKMSQKDPAQAGEASYAFLAQLLHLQGIDEENRQHSEFADLAEEHCQLLREGRLRRAVTIRQRAVFSRDGIRAEQADYLRQTAEELARKLYERGGTLQKFWLRWFRHIVK